jgi:hypothetical protein
MSNLLEHLIILILKVIFPCGKMIESFQKKNSLKSTGLGDQFLIKNVFENFDFLEYIFYPRGLRFLKDLCQGNFLKKIEKKSCKCLVSIKKVMQ